MTIKNQTGSKQVRITESFGSFYAQYSVNCNDAEGGQVQKSKMFLSLKGAQRWALTVLEAPRA
jgi:hypothetical protein